MGTPTLTVSGTVIPQITEADVRAGGQTITLTLSSEGRWKTDIGANNSHTSDLLNGITASGASPTGWNAVVKPALSYTQVMRVSDQVVTITLPAVAAYDIVVSETVTVTIPDTTWDPSIGPEQGLIVHIPVPSFSVTVATTAAAASALTPSLDITPTVPTMTPVVATTDVADNALTETLDLTAEVPTMTPEAELVYEHYQTGDDGGFKVAGTQWQAQSFTPGANHTPNRVAIKINGVTGNPGTATVGIQTIVSGSPDGIDLATATFDPTSYKDPVANWVSLTITPGLLVSGTVYAIVVRAPSGDTTSNFFNWRADTTSPTYSGGSKFQSTNSGSTWTADTSADYMFDEGVV